MKIDRLKSGLIRWESSLGILVIVVVAISAQTTPGFTSQFNVSSSFAQMSEKALMVLPLVLLIVAREIDISVASIAGLCAASAGLVLREGGSPLTAAIAAVVVGLLCGCLNGFFVAVLGLPSLVVTLGTLALFRGLCYVVLGNEPVSNIPPALINLGNNNVPGTYIPQAFVPFLILAPLFALVLHRSVVGRHIYAIGGNPETARYSGVKLRKVRFLMFVLTGAVCSIAGIVNVGRTSQAVPDALLGYELDAITVVFLGGISVLGGKGRMSGVLWALVMVVSLRSVLQLQGESGYTQGTAVGLLLIFSLLANNIVASVTQRLENTRARRAQLRTIDIENSKNVSLSG